MTASPAPRPIRARTRNRPPAAEGLSNVVPLIRPLRTRQGQPIPEVDDELPENDDAGADAPVGPIRPLRTQQREVTPAVRRRLLHQYIRRHGAVRINDEAGRRRFEQWLADYRAGIIQEDDPSATRNDPDVAQTPEPPQIRRMSEIEERPVQWLWHPYVPRGMMTVLAGKGGRGKGLTCTDLAARVTTGAGWPNSPDGADQGNVLWCEAEDPAHEVLRARFEAAGADCTRIHYASVQAFRELLLPRTLAGDPAVGLSTYLTEHQIRLIVMSPFTSFLPGLRDSNSNEAVRASLETLQQAIEAADCALIGIMHVSKKPDLAAVERILGSSAFANFVRSVLIVEQEPEADHSVRRMAHAKYNVATKGADLLYTARYVGEDPRQRDQRVRIDWSVPEGGDADADRLFDRPRQGPERRQPAGEWLIEYLDGRGPVPRADVIAAGEAAGFTARALRAAQQRDGRILTRRTDTMPATTVWELQPGAPQVPPGVANMR